MLLRSIVFLMLINFSLAAQPVGWQSYLFANYLVGGAETQDYRWIATVNSVARFDKITGKAELFHFQNSLLPKQILDIERSSENKFTVLGSNNELATWEEGIWTKNQLELPPNEDNLRKIVGNTGNGSLLLVNNQKLYSLSSEGDIEQIPFTEQASQNNSIQQVLLDSEDRIWIKGHAFVTQLAVDGTTLFSSVFEEEYLYDMKMDHSDNIWLTTNRYIYLWLNEAQQLVQLPLDDLGINSSGGVISAVLEQEAIFTINGRIFQISYSNDSFQNTELTDAFAFAELPGSYGFQDSNGLLWYQNYHRELLSWQIGTLNAPEEAIVNPWLEVSGINTLGLDPQGKVWVGGSDKVAYLMGGRWHNVLLDSTGFLSIGINDIVFKDDGTPIIGSGDQFIFGFPDSQVREWNGVSWDTLTNAITVASFLPITHLEWDHNGNLWVLRASDNLFSVRYRGQWYRYRLNDVPAIIGSFLCFAQGIDGSMWIGTDNGLLNYDGFSFTHTEPSAYHAGAHSIESIAVDERGDKWLSLRYDGLRHEVNGEWTVVEEVADLAAQHGVKKVICGTYPEVWATLYSQGGLLHFDGTDWEYLSPENSGLIDGYITDILCDHLGRIWFSSQSSVTVYSPSTPVIKAFERPSFTNLAVYPNPGCCQYEISWEALKPGGYQLDIIAENGQVFRTWELNATVAGDQIFSFDQGDLPAGVYFLSLKAGSQRIGSTRLIVLR
jgi:ligand-binding sensor domain-containing protein